MEIIFDDKPFIEVIFIIFKYIFTCLYFDTTYVYNDIQKEIIKHKKDIQYTSWIEGENLKQVLRQDHENEIMKDQPTGQMGSWGGFTLNINIFQKNISKEKENKCKQKRSQSIYNHQDESKQ